jgi:hypothetical protein
MVCLLILAILCGNNAAGVGFAYLAIFCFLIIAVGVVVDLFTGIFK